MLSLLLALALSQPLEAHTGKSGMTVFVTGAPTRPVSTPPTLGINGSGVPLVPGPVSDGFWAFGLPSGSQIKPSDSLRLTALSGWAGDAPALDIPVRNNAGRCEFPTPERPTMGLGVNISHTPLGAGALYCPAKNWATRLRPWNWNGPAVAAFDSAGNPTRFAPGRKSVENPVSISAVGNLIDAGGVPTLAGLFAVVWDSPDPDTQFALASWQNPGGGWDVRPRPELGSPGANGVGITRVYEVTRPEGMAKNYPEIVLVLSHPAGAPRYSNLWVIPPGNDFDRSDPMSLEAWTQGRLSLGGGKGPSILRFMDSTQPAGNDSNVADPTDLADPTTSTWTSRGRGTLTANITRLRPVDLATASRISTVYGAVAIPSKAIFDNGSRGIAEAVTDQPHGFGTGQTAILDLSGVAGLSFGGRAVSFGRAGTHAWVTGPTTFVCELSSGAFPQSGPQDLDAAVATPGATATVTLPGSVLPYEFAAATAGRFDGCTLWIPIPPYASNALVDAIAGKVLANLPEGHKVIPEYGNENWNWGFSQSTYCLTMGKLLGLPAGWTDYYSVRRSAEVAARFASVFSRAGRSGDVLMVLAGQFGWMGRPWLSYAASQGIRADVVSFAPYFELPATMGAAADSWSPAQLHDLFRHYLALDGEPKKYWADMSKAIGDYERAIGKRVLRYSYEGGTTAMAGGLSTPLPRTWDCFAHPDALDTERVFYAQCQAAGVDVLTYYAFACQPFSNANNFGLWNYQGQLEGRGDGSDGRAVNRMIGSTGQWVPSVSVRGQAWRDWQRGYLMGR